MNIFSHPVFRAIKVGFFDLLKVFIEGIITRRNSLAGALIVLLCSCYCAWTCKNHPFFKDAGPLVKTNSGALTGTYVKVFDSDVAAFLGIPFAKPPVGNKRFQKPEPIESWEGPLLANKKPPPCIQYSSKNFTFISTSPPNEDCLYLNVWTPKERDTKELFPVLVWIHGGAFAFGSTDIDLYDGSVIAAYGKAVVVSMNYRLGSLGFLNFGTKDAPGNMGLHDQKLAMKWVKENIYSFGGDPDKITLFGESAGSISASLHLVSPLSRNLFNRAILQSGTAFHYNVMDSPAIAKAKSNVLAESAHCASSNDVAEPSVVISCLKKLDAMTLAHLENQMTSKTVMFFGPSYGNEFLPVSSIEAYGSGDVAPVDVLLGCNRDEGSLFLNFMFPDTFPSDTSPNPNKSKIEEKLKKIFPNLPPEKVSEILNFYLENFSGDEMTKVASDIVGDSFFNCPTMYLAEKLENAHVYHLTHRSSKESGAEWMGVSHFYEVPFVFGKPLVDTNEYTPEDGRFSGDIIRKWVSFAENGHPIAEEQWPKFSSAHLSTYELNPRNNRQIKYPRKKVCEFLRDFLLQS